MSTGDSSGESPPSTAKTASSRELAKRTVQMKALAEVDARSAPDEALDDAFYEAIARQRGERPS